MDSKLKNAKKTSAVVQRDGFSMEECKWIGWREDFIASNFDWETFEKIKTAMADPKLKNFKEVHAAFMH